MNSSPTQLTLGDRVLARLVTTSEGRLFVLQCLTQEEATARRLTYEQLGRLHTCDDAGTEIWQSSAQVYDRAIQILWGAQTAELETADPRKPELGPKYIRDVWNAAVGTHESIETPRAIMERALFAQVVAERSVSFIRTVLHAAGLEEASSFARALGKVANLHEAQAEKFATLALESAPDANTHSLALARVRLIEERVFTERKREALRLALRGKLVRLRTLEHTLVRVALAALAPKEEPKVFGSPADPRFDEKFRVYSLWS